MTRAFQRDEELLDIRYWGSNDTPFFPPQGSGGHQAPWCSPWQGPCCHSGWCWVESRTRERNYLQLWFQIASVASPLCLLHTSREEATKNRHSNPSISCLTQKKWSHDDDDDSVLKWEKESAKPQMNSTTLKLHGALSKIAMRHQLDGSDTSHLVCRYYKISISDFWWLQMLLIDGTRPRSRG